MVEISHAENFPLATAYIDFYIGKNEFWNAAPKHLARKSKPYRLWWGAIIPYDTSDIDSAHSYQFKSWNIPFGNCCMEHLICMMIEYRTMKRNWIRNKFMTNTWMVFVCGYGCGLWGGGPTLPFSFRKNDYEFIFSSAESINLCWHAVTAIYRRTVECPMRFKAFKFHM